MIARRTFLIGAGIATGAAKTWHAMGNMADYTAEVARTRAQLPAAPEIHDLLRFATLAASGHNAQPWHFRVTDGQISILPDYTRRTPVVDPDDHHLFISLGCAAENLALAASARGRPGELRFDPLEQAVIHGGTGLLPNDPALFAAIPRRQSTRAEYDGGPIPSADLRTLADTPTSGVDLVLLTEPAKIAAVRDLVLSGNTMQMTDPAFMGELKSWLRFSPATALATSDGLFSATTGNPPIPQWLGDRLFRFLVTARSENDRYARQLATTPALAIFVARSEGPEHWIAVGRAAQHFALRATALGLKQAFINQSVEVATLRPALAALIGLPGRRPDLVMRLGHGPTFPSSARRPVAATMLRA